MYRYLEWARGATGMTTDQIIVAVLDHALSDYFRRDKSWRSSCRPDLAPQQPGEWRELFGYEASLARRARASA
jgi:hypothetical protein